MNRGETSPPLPPLLETAASLRGAVSAARSAGMRVGLVPTMGALHEGHLSLVKAARESCEFVVVTIFVNPSQFGPQEDLARYPRTLENDLRLLAPLGVGAVFQPSPNEMYPDGFSTWIEPPDVARLWEGACRPGHFRGVATVVLKLLNMAAPQAAFFGAKDYQQSLVVRHMARDLDLPVEICVCPTVREPDGLALSSRNAYLSSRERGQALSLSRALRRAADLVQAGERDVPAIERELKAIMNDAGISEIEYAAVADAQTLAPLKTIDTSAVALIAARAGQTRLIDNQMLVIDGAAHTES